MNRKIISYAALFVVIIGLLICLLSLMDPNQLKPEVVNFIALRTGDPDEYIIVNGNKYSTNLTRLDLSGHELGDQDIEPLESMTNLVELNLHDNDISDISPLKDLAKLEILRIGGNRIENLSALQKLDNLEELYLNDNSIQDITPLKDLTKMKVLSLRVNHISELAPLINLKQLERIDLSGNLIQDFTILNSLDNLRLIVLFDIPQAEEQRASLKAAKPDAVILTGETP
jgi:Leucine-rich repeat (LRR) protein